MEIDLIFRIAGIGIIISILNQILARSEKGEYAMITTLAGVLIAGPPGKSRSGGR